MKRICIRCLHVGIPQRLFSKNAGIWYLGCASCGSGVFYSHGGPLNGK